MICPTCKRQVGTFHGRIRRHVPLMKIPGQAPGTMCPMGGKPVPETEG